MAPRALRAVARRPSTDATAPPPTSATLDCVDAPGDDSWATGTPWAAVRDAGLLDPEWYVRATPELPPGVDPLWHYAHRGERSGRTPNPWFDPAWYLATYPDVRDVGASPLVHYLGHGAAEGRDPGPDFDTAWYLRTNPDVRAAGVNPLAHFVTTGVLEGRAPLARTSDAARGSAVLVSGEPATPGHRYRVERLADALERLGWFTTVVDVPEAASKRLAAVDDADLVVLWRTAWGPEVEQVVHRARRHQVPVVFDVDDLMVDPTIATVAVVDGIRSQDLTEAEAADWFAKMGRTAAEADACTCTTEPIATALRLLGRPTHVVPNGIDDATLVRSRLARRTRDLAGGDGLVRLGYAGGSRTHQRDLAVAADAVADVLRAHPHVRLVLYRDALLLDELSALDGLHDQVEWRDLVPHQDLPDELARLDVNLAPLEVDNVFCEAKSDLKHFEAALVGVPTVASPTGPFRDAIRHGVDGFLCADTEAWRTALGELVDDAELRARVGEAARRRVLWQRGTLDRVQRVDAVVEQLLGGRGAARAFALARHRDAGPAPADPPTAPRSVEVISDRLRPSLVTVVVPVHDYADVLGEALDSVRDQTLVDLDLVVVDDASTDSSAEVAAAWLAEHGSRFGRAVLIRHDANAGVACARNAGFLAADTPYVLPLDADNALEPTCCERLLAALGPTDAAGAYPRIAHMGQTTELLAGGVTRGYLPYDPQRLVGSNWIDAMAMVRVDAWAMAGGYQRGLLGWEDYDLWCRFAELGLRLLHVPEDLARYRVHEGSMLHTLTHVGDRPAQVRAAITERHPWLRLTPDPEPGAPDPVAAIVATPSVAPRLPRPEPTDDPSATPDDGRLSDRACQVLPLLRCPETGEPLEEDPDGGVRSRPSGHRWPVVAGRPVLDPERRAPTVHPSDHVGNPLPERARQLVATASGPVLHLSGGGTAAGHGAVELDLDVYRPTDVVGDAHHLPFEDATFALVVAMNAFEHYRRPDRVAAEIRRVLRPGGLVFVHTAFLQPVHEAPHHYFNATRWGVEAWFEAFESVDLGVSDNLHPGFTLAWLAAEAIDATGASGPGGLDGTDGDAVPRATLADLAELWHQADRRADDPTWVALAALRGATRDRLAAGFEYLGRRPG